jgi:hypothetical protein
MHEKSTVLRIYEQANTSISAGERRSKADEARLWFGSCESSIERCDVGRRSMEQVIFFMMEVEFLFLSL